MVRKSTVGLLLLVCPSLAWSEEVRVVKYAGSSTRQVDLSGFSRPGPDGASYIDPATCIEPAVFDGGEGADAGKLKISGENLVFYGALDLSGGDGGKGTDGHDFCLIPGENCETKGIVGGSGGNGGKGGSFFARGDYLTFQSPSPFPVIQLNTAGGNGGAAGSSGDGENNNGMPGGNGGQGGELSLKAVNQLNFTVETIGNVTGGAGGAGGAGGNTPVPETLESCSCFGQTRPGDGGKGGDAGTPGTLNVKPCEATAHNFTIVAGSKNGGDGGDAGIAYSDGFLVGHKQANGGNGGNAFTCWTCQPVQVGFGGETFNFWGESYAGDYDYCTGDPLTPYPGSPGTDGELIEVEEPKLRTRDCGGTVPGDSEGWWVPTITDIDTGWVDTDGPCPTPPNCSYYRLSDTEDNPGSFQCGSVQIISFVDTDGAAYCVPVYVAGETLEEDCYLDRVFTLDTTPGQTVIVRVKSDIAKNLLAVGTYKDLSAEGLSRGDAGEEHEIKFVADGSTYYITLESWLYADDLKVEIVCGLPGSSYSIPYPLVLGNNDLDPYNGAYTTDRLDGYQSSGNGMWFSLDVPAQTQVNFNFDVAPGELGIGIFEELPASLPGIITQDIINVSYRNATNATKNIRILLNRHSVWNPIQLSLGIQAASCTAGGTGDTIGNAVVGNLNGTFSSYGLCDNIIVSSESEWEKSWLDKAWKITPPSGKTATVTYSPNLDFGAYNLAVIDSSGVTKGFYRGYHDVGSTPISFTTDGGDYFIIMQVNSTDPSGTLGLQVQ